MRRAVVVAHPDDESLFFGGLVIAEPGDWTVICCTIPRIDPVRAEKFHDACAVLGARGVVLPFVEPPPHVRIDHLAALELDGFDEIVTHNDVGEYGHEHHKQVHGYVLDHCPGRTVVGGYGQLSVRGHRRYALSAVQYEWKLNAIRCYDHVSPTDGRPKWEALLARYGQMFDLTVEMYGRG